MVHAVLLLKVSIFAWYLRLIKAKFMPFISEMSAYRISIRNCRKYRQENGKQT